MTGDRSKFVSLKPKGGGFVTFGNNAKGKIIGIGKVGKNSSLCIENVLLVDGLKHNLLSISQLCDKGYRVTFKSNKCIIEDDDKTLFVAYRIGNIYAIEFEEIALQNVHCFSALNENHWLWHRRLGHASMDLISKLSRQELVRGLPKAKFSKDGVCSACQFGKQTKSSFKTKSHISTTRPLQLIHMDLFGPIAIASLGGKHYAFVIVDDYSRYTCVFFLAHKDETHATFVAYCRRVQNEKGYAITHVRSDRGSEFANKDVVEVPREIIDKIKSKLE